MFSIARDSKPVQIAAAMGVVILSVCCIRAAHAAEPGKASAARLCAATAGSQACTAGALSLNLERLPATSSGRGKPAVAERTQLPARPAKTIADPEREIWRHQGVG